MASSRQVNEMDLDEEVYFEAFFGVFTGDPSGNDMTPRQRFIGRIIKVNWASLPLIDAIQCTDRLDAIERDSHGHLQLCCWQIDVRHHFSARMFHLSHSKGFHQLFIDGPVIPSTSINCCGL